MEYYSIELLEFFYYLLFTAGISVPLKEQKNIVKNKKLELNSYFKR